MSLDTTLRALTGARSPALVRMLTGAAPVKPLPTEFPSAQNRRVDALLRLDDGAVLHLEWQGQYDAAMPRRMLGYWQLITNAYPGAPLHQIVIQVGGDRPIPAALQEGRLSFDYRVIDSRNLDPAPLLASPELDDVLLAALFGSQAGLPATLHAILSRIAALEPCAQRDALTQASILAGRRGITLSDRELEALPMPLTVTYEDLKANPLLAHAMRGIDQMIAAGQERALRKGQEKGRQEGREKGREEAQRENLRALLLGRFNALTPQQQHRVETAKPEQIALWFNRAITAATLDAVFNDPQIN